MQQKLSQDGLNTSLRCLQHSLVWISIVLLVLNDHLLKAVAPSWLTGKLSDLAGLFFFPFLLAAGFSLLLDRWRVPARRTGEIAFALTGAWFTLLKTVPWANALTADLASYLLGFPARFARDPTDLLALVALWPAWHLWKHPPKVPARRTAWIALAAGTLASLATSPLPPAPNLNRLVHIDGVLYAVDTEQKIVDRSEDGGQTWKEIHRESGYSYDRTPADVPRDDLLTGEVALPLAICHPREPQRCYRITGEERIDTSTDGGLSWETAWTIPPGRRAFMERHEYWRPLDLAPRDLLFFDWQGQTYLLAAMGTEGVLRHRIPDGEWERRGVPFARPTPYAEEEPAAAVVIVYNEMSLGMAVALFTLLATCALSWHTLRRHMEQPDPPYATWQPLRPILLVVVTGSVLILASVLLREPVTSIVTYFMGQACCLPLWLGLGLVVLALVFTWRRIAREMPHLAGAGWLAAWWGLVFAAVLLQATIPWFLWARGTIAFYETALLLALLALPLIAGGLYGAWWMSRRAATSPAGPQPE